MAKRKKICPKCGNYEIEACECCGVTGCPECDKFEAPYRDDSSIFLCPKCATEAHEEWAQERAKVKTDYEAACNEYLRLFCEKHEYDFDDARNSWVAGDVGGITCLGCDLFVNLSDIQTDIDKNAPVDEFLKWYDYCLRISLIQSSIPQPDGVCTRLQCKSVDFITPNYGHWLRGCPRKSDAELTEIEEDLKADLAFREEQREKWRKWEDELKEMAKQGDF